MLVAEMNSPQTLRRGNAALFDQRDRPPGARQQPRRRRAGRPAADDDRVYAWRGSLRTRRRQSNG